MIEEATVLVVRDHQERPAPTRAFDHSVHNPPHQVLPLRNICRWSVIVAWWDINEVGVDKRHRRQLSRLSIRFETRNTLFDNKLFIESITIEQTQEAVAVLI